MSAVRPHLLDKPHWVYQLLDEDDQVLYVGCTSKEPTERFIMLYGENPTVRRAPVRRWTAELYPDAATGQLAEGRLIDELDPPYNYHKSGRQFMRAGVKPVAAIGSASGTTDQWLARQAS